jgi:hypothetical protein
MTGLGRGGFDQDDMFECVEYGVFLRKRVVNRTKPEKTCKNLQKPRKSH